MITRISKRVYKFFKKLDDMGLIRIIKGVKDIVEGIAEEDGAKIGKGFFKIVKGCVTTLLGRGSDSEDDAEDFDE